jgi:signal transduction histidine kinase
MPTNAWDSFGRGTVEAERAGQLRRLWDGYLSRGDVDQVRLPIAESWERSHVAGVDPAVPRASTQWPDRHDVAVRWQEHPLRTALPTIHRWLGQIAVANDQLIVVSDPYGVLLWLWGDERVRSAAFDAMNFVEGALWSETSAGTNAVGTALAADHPVQVHAAEHYLQAVHGWTCSAAPVHDPETGDLLGILDLSGFAGTAHAPTLPTTLAAARAVEADLRVQAQIRDARLRVSYLDRLGRSRERLALVSSTGRVIADPDGFLHASHIEIPSDGGIRLLPSGGEALAEPLAGTDAFILRPMPPVRQRTVGQDEDGSPSDQLGGWEQAQIELSRLADEQAALRRVATLVAGRATPGEIFSSVAEEIARVFHTDRSAVCRYEQDGTVSIVAHWPPDGRNLSVESGERIDLDGDSVAALIQRSGQPSRIDSYEGLAGSFLDQLSSLGTSPQSTVGAPILAEGRVWGSVLAVSTVEGQPVAAGAESELAAFAELIAMAVSNAVALAALNASRVRIVEAGDNARRKIERDIHDGAQQRLNSLALSLGSAIADQSAGPDELRQELKRATDALESALEELRETARGIHPAILSKRGLPAALGTLSRRSAIPVDLEIELSCRLPERVEVAAYYVVSELITNRCTWSSATMDAAGRMPPAGPG